MKILVTGGAGFIGSNLCIKLLSDGHQIRVLDDLSNGSTTNLDLTQIDFVEGSILNTSLLGKVVRDVDSVVHLAALGSVPRSIQDPKSSIEVNFTGTLNVLEALKDRKTPMIFSSSSSLYGESKVLPRVETTAAEPRSPYAVSKLAAESLVSAYYHSYGIPTLSFRFFNVYGPRQSFGHPYAAAIPIFFESLLKEEPLRIFGDGEQVRDFTYVDFVTDAISEAIEKRSYCSTAVNLGSASKISINALVDLMCKITARTPKIEHLPERNGDVRNSYANTEKLLNLFPLLAPTDIEVGLQITYEWYLSNMGKNNNETPLTKKSS
jgi:UDP-glucose 4-epimerase